MGDVEAMCHWAGLTTTGTGLLPQAVYPSPGFVWAANESGLDGLQRYLGDQAVALRPGYDPAGADGDRITRALRCCCCLRQDGRVFFMPDFMSTSQQARIYDSELDRVVPASEPIVTGVQQCAWR